MGQALLAYTQPYITPDTSLDGPIGDIAVTPHPVEVSAPISDGTHVDSGAITSTTEVTHSDAASSDADPTQHLTPDSTPTSTHIDTSETVATSESSINHTDTETHAVAEQVNTDTVASNTTLSPTIESSSASTDSSAGVHPVTTADASHLDTHVVTDTHSPTTSTVASEVTHSETATVTTHSSETVAIDTHTISSTETNPTPVVANEVTHGEVDPSVEVNASDTSTSHTPTEVTTAVTSVQSETHPNVGIETTVANTSTHSVTASAPAVEKSDVVTSHVQTEIPSNVAVTTTQTPTTSHSETVTTSTPSSTTAISNTAQTAVTLPPPNATNGAASSVVLPPVAAVTPATSTPAVSFNSPQANQPLVGVIDTGFAANNPDIDYSHITLGHDYVANDANPLLQSGEGNEHGTHVLGIIAAKQNNGVGIDGINDDAPLWVGRAEVNSDQWAQSLMEFVDAAKASKQPNAVVNLSFNLTNLDGTPRFELTAVERAALAYAQQHNVLVVASAGDNPGEMSAVGQASLEFDNIVTVGSAERVNNSVALSKAYDRAEYSGSGYALDIVAPGGTEEKPITVTSGNGVTKEFGTSVATAKVSGAASQVWAANPDLSYRQVIDILKRTATDLKTSNWDLETGAGLLNITAAVHLAKVTPAIDVDVPVRYDFKKSDQPLIGIIDTGFISKNPDIDYRRVILGRDRVDNDNNPLLENGEGSEHGSHILGIIGATQGNGIGIDGMNDDAPIWLGRAIGSGKWAESLREFVDAAKASGQLNAVVNLSFDLTQINPDSSVTTRYELTPQEREALEYARQNGVMVVVAAGNNGGTMSALGQASQEFDNVITVGSIDYNGNRADYSNFGFGLDFVARGGTSDQPVMSTVGEGADLGLLSGEEEPPEDEMSIIARNTFEEVFGPFSAPQELESDEQELENLTPEERQVYDEATKEIDQLLKDYLGAASQKIALEYVDGYYAASVDALSQFVDAFDEDLADNLIKAEEILGNAGFSTNASTTATNLDFSIPLDLGVGEMAGTSVAAAKVTGAVSQVWAANPRLSYPQVKEILQKTAVDLNSRGWDAATGSGLVNVEAAIELAKRTQPQSYQPKPIQSPLIWSGEGKVTPGERAVSVSVPSFTGRVMDAGYVTSVGFLRIRSGPGQGYGEVGRKYPGEAINFDAYENNGSWVDDPYMPGGGSSRWYKIAGTNNWMSALYIDNTPERAEQERQRLEAIRRAEEEARRAEEELQRILEEQRRAEEETRRRAEEARRRIEEELRRILEEERRKQEQFQVLVNEVAKKYGELGALLGSYVSNGVTVYQFDNGTLFVQPDGSHNFYKDGQVYEAEKKKFQDLKKIANAKKIDDLINQKIVDPKGFFNTLDALYPAAKWLSPALVVDGAIGTREFFVNGKGKFLLKVTDFLKPVGEFLDEDLIKVGGKSALKRAGALDLVFTVGDIAFAETEEKKRRAQIKAGAAVLAGGIGAVVGGVFGVGAGAIPVGLGAAVTATAIMDGIYTGADILGLGDDLDNAIGNSYSAVSSFTNTALEAAKEKAKAAVDKAKELADKAKAAYQTATATVQQAKAAYQTFKTEVQKVTTQIVQQSQQKIKEEAQKILSKVVQNPVVQQTSKVVNHIANYAQKAVQTVGNVINGAKQFANNVINTGRKFVNNVIETGKKAYETVKNVVINTYETGKKVVTETYNKAVQAVNTVKDTVSNGFNAVKSVFRFGW